MNCPLCLAQGNLTIVEGPDNRPYRKCNTCNLVFTNLRILSDKKEKNRKQKQVPYPGYAKDLRQSVEWVLPYLAPGMEGIGIGFNTEGVLPNLLQKKNITCKEKGARFLPAEAENKFDFIFASECFSHYFFPAKEIKALLSLLKEEGLLMVMTESWNSLDQFSKWRFAKEPEHVSFYHAGTFDYLSRKFSLEKVFTDEKRLVIFRKKAKSTAETQEPSLEEAIFPRQ
jgi:SAM-dependent methyltransferase